MELIKAIVEFLAGKRTLSDWGLIIVALMTILFAEIATWFVIK